MPDYMFLQITYRWQSLVSQFDLNVMIWFKLLIGVVTHQEHRAKDATDYNIRNNRHKNLFFFRESGNHGFEGWAIPFHNLDKTNYGLWADQQILFANQITSGRLRK